MKVQVIALIVGVIALVIIASTPFSSPDAQAESLNFSVDEMQRLIGMDCGGGYPINAGQTCDRDAESECWCVTPIIENCSHIYGACGKENEFACSGGCTGNCTVYAANCSGTRTYQTCEASWGCWVGMCSKTDQEPVYCPGTKKLASYSC